MSIKLYNIELALDGKGKVDKALYIDTYLVNKLTPKMIIGTRVEDGKIITTRLPQKNLNLVYTNVSAKGDHVCFRVYTLSTDHKFAKHQAYQRLLKDAESYVKGQQYKWKTYLEKVENWKLQYQDLDNNV